MRIKTVALLCLFIVMTSGCSDDTPVKSYLTRVIQPLDAGRSWSYELSRYLVNPSPPNATLSDGTIETTVLGHVLIDGESWARVRSIRFLREFNIILNDTALSYDTTVTYLSNRANGLYSRPSALDTGLLVTRFPVSLNTLWALDDTTQAELTSNSYNMLIQAGAFSAHEYTITIPELHPLDSIFEYWVPDLGLIQRESRSTSTGLDDLYIEQLILVDYVK